MIEVPFLTPEPIDADTLEERVRGAESGAVVTFQGVVSPDREGAGRLEHLVYEAYEPMALKEMALLARETRERWPLTRVLAQHRTGRVNVGETSLFIAVSSPGRSEGFEACRFVLDRIRSRVPLWKKDVFADGATRWSTRHHETMLLSDDVIEISQG